MPLHPQIYYPDIKKGREVAKSNLFIKHFKN